MLGNDIVDLQVVLTSGQAQRPGFQDRISSSSELPPLRSYFDEEHCTWLLWAIKESAYKYYIQAEGQPIFAPKKFRFIAQKLQEDTVEGYTETPVGKVRSTVRLTKAHITAESWSETSSHLGIHRHVYGLSASGQVEKSKQLKRLVCMQWAAAFGKHSEEISIQKDHRQVPYLYDREEKLPYAISLSHHGAWGFFSYQKENSPFLG